MTTYDYTPAGESAADPELDELYRAITGRKAFSYNALSDPLYRAAADRHGYAWAKMERLERYAFYERAKKAFLIVQTGETRKYGNVILRKGVTPA